MGIIGQNTTNCPSGGDDISYIASAEVFLTFLVVENAQLTKPLSARRVPLIPLLKLATYRETAADRWSQVYFRQLVYKNRIITPRIVKKDFSNFS